MSQKFNGYGYIYITTNQQTKKVYVGQKSGLPEESPNYLGSGTRLKNSIKKHGKQFFKKRILGILEAGTKKELKILLNESETECIYFYRSFGSDAINYDDIYGYNMTPIGGSTLGGTHASPTQETIEKIRLWNLNKEVSEEARQNMSIAQQNRTDVRGTPTQETIEKIRISNSGQTRSEEARQNMSIGQKNREWGLKDISLIRITENLIKKEVEDTFRKNSIVDVKKVHSEEANKKKSIASSGENNPMFGKRVFDMWIEKYGYEEAVKREENRISKQKAKREENKNKKLLIQEDIKNRKNEMFCNNMECAENSICSRFYKKYNFLNKEILVNVTKNLKIGEEKECIYFLPMRIRKINK